MDLNPLVFAALALFVVIMLAKSFMPRRMPGQGKLRQNLSPQFQKFLASLPLPVDHPLTDLCRPWTATKDPGYSKAFLPLWQTRDGEPSYLETYIKLGSKPTFYGVARTTNEQAFLGALVLKVMVRLYEKDRPEALSRGRRAAEAMGFRHFDDATKFLHEWITPPPAEDGDEDYDNDDTEEDEIEGAVQAFVKEIEKLDKRK